MTTRSASSIRFRRDRLPVLCGLALVAASAVGVRVSAQTEGSSAQELRQQVEQRFDVLVVQDGLALRPKGSVRDVRWIEVSEGDITVNGVAVTGAELRSKLGDDASVVMQLSYLEPAAREAMFRDAGDRSRGDGSTTSRSTSRASRGADGDQFKIGGSITVPEGDSVSGDVVVVGGAIHVLGEVRGDVVAIGGTVELGPGSRVGGDVAVIGGSLRRDPTARIGGEIADVGVGSIEAWGTRLPHGWWREAWGGRTFGSGVALFSTLARVAILCLLAALVVLLGRDHVLRIGARAAAEPLKAGAIGVLAQLLFLPLLIVTIVFLIVTIVGIPLLVLIPFALLTLALVALVGFASVAHHVGRLLNQRFGWVGGGPYASTIAGTLILASPLLLARVFGLVGGVMRPMTLGLGAMGIALEYVAWTIGFGAVALAWFYRPGPIALPTVSEGPGPTPA